MTKSTSPTQPDTALACPSWCAGDHAGAGPNEGFHHNSSRTKIPAPSLPGRETHDGAWPEGGVCVSKTDEICVYISAFQPAGGGLEEQHVEITGLENTACVNLTALTVGEARQLAAALVEAADQLASSSVPQG